MALVSSLVSTKSNLQEISVSSKVNEDEVVLDDSAKTYYNNLAEKNTGYYAKLAKAFENAADDIEFLIDKKAITGDKIVSNMKKKVTALRKQAEYCRNRRQSLEDKFDYAELEMRVRKLEEDE